MCGDWDAWKRTLYIFFILQKHNVLLILWVYTNTIIPFTDLNDVLLLCVQSKLTEHFKLFLLLSLKLQVV